MCASSARVGAGLEETKAEQAPPSRKGADPGGEGCVNVDGDGGMWGCRLTLAVCPAQLLQAITAAPPSAPPLRLLRGRGRTTAFALRSRAALASLPSETKP